MVVKSPYVPSCAMQTVVSQEVSVLPLVLKAMDTYSSKIGLVKYGLRTIDYMLPSLLSESDSELLTTPEVCFVVI